jgi:hypothetical protein
MLDADIGQRCRDHTQIIRSLTISPGSVDPTVHSDSERRPGELNVTKVRHCHVAI